MKIRNAIVSDYIQSHHTWWYIHLTHTRTYSHIHIHLTHTRYLPSALCNNVVGSLGEITARISKVSLVLWTISYCATLSGFKRTTEVITDASLMCFASTVDAKVQTNASYLYVGQAFLWDSLYSVGWTNYIAPGQTVSWHLVPSEVDPKCFEMCVNVLKKHFIDFCS